MVSMRIGEKIRELRMLKNMTLDDFADKANLSVSYVSYLERGKRKINFKALESVSKALEIPIPVLTLLAASEDELSMLSEFDLSSLQASLNDYLQMEYGGEGNTST